MAVHIINDLDSIAGRAVAGTERAREAVLVGAGVLEAACDVGDLDNVVGGTLEEDEGDLVLGGGRPGDGEGLASLNNLCFC